MDTSGDFAAQTRAFECDELIYVQLEDCQKTLLVSKALLCSASDYFKKALDGAFTEANTRNLTVPGCDLVTFRLYLYYYTNGRSFQFAKHPATNSRHRYLSGQEGQCAAHISLIRLWVSADGFLMPTLQNAAMNFLISFLRNSTVHPDAMCFAFENSAEESLLRRALFAETAHDLFHRRMDSDHMNALGAVPEFFELFLDIVGDCKERIIDCDCRTPCVPSFCVENEEAPKAGMIKEEAVKIWHVAVKSS